MLGGTAGAQATLAYVDRDLSSPDGVSRCCTRHVPCCCTRSMKIAVVDDKSAYGKGLADEIAKAMEAKSAKPALRESITAGEKDYSGLVTKL